jgi:hypothetical protein
MRVATQIMARRELIPKTAWTQGDMFEVTSVYKNYQVVILQ